jgi:hypothetical protein
MKTGKKSINKLIQNTCKLIKAREQRRKQETKRKHFEERRKIVVPYKRIKIEIEDMKKRVKTEETTVK